MAQLLVRHAVNLQKTVLNGEKGWSLAQRWRRNAGQFKTGTLVGADTYGNKYFEDLGDDNINNLYGRHRWVEYPDTIRERSATQVPPEWHGWLHYTTDLTGPEMLAKFGAGKPHLNLNHERTATGTSRAYTPDNYHTNARFNVAQAVGEPEGAPEVDEKHVHRARRTGISVEDL